MSLICLPIMNYFHAQEGSRKEEVIFIQYYIIYVLNGLSAWKYMKGIEQ